MAENFLSGFFLVESRIHGTVEACSSLDVVLGSFLNFWMSHLTIVQDLLAYITLLDGFYLSDFLIQQVPGIRSGCS